MADPNTDPDPATDPNRWPDTVPLDDIVATQHLSKTRVAYMDGTGVVHIAPPRSTISLGEPLHCEFAIPPTEQAPLAEFLSVYGWHHTPTDRTEPALSHAAQLLRPLDTPPSFTIEDTKTGAEWTAENIEWKQHAFESTHGVVSRSEPTGPVTFIEGKLVDGRYTLFEKLGLDD